MAEFKRGQRVHVEYEGTIESVGSTSLGVKRDGSGYCLVSLAKSKVTLLDPANWPPQVGDIWEAEGREYYVYQHHNPERPGVRSFAREDIYWYAEGLEGFKAFNPALVRRRGQ